ncbi:HAMP domain-containing sensor histidine kinase [Nocardia sp. NPDC005978]|uniref:sensor histidine kinase n=1 Tax=Nocardia sp. NPDC005978 TaxID=3156725 RepID=UPI0033B1FC4E
MRTRVALASAATAAVVVAIMSTVLLAVAGSDARTQVGTVVNALAVTRNEGSGPDGASPAVPTVPSHGDRTVLPTLPDGTQGVPAVPLSDTVPSELLGPGAEFARTFPVDGRTVMLAVPQAVADDSATKQRTRVIGIGLAATALAALLGWYFASRAVAPLRRLTAATAGLGDRLSLDAPRHPVASETTELTEAMNTMLARIAGERQHTSEALVTARDFAATAAHELRTPLTAMRTDLQVLRSVELPAAERAQILDEVLAGQRAIESTLYALERLAVGDLTTESDWEDVDLGQLADQVVEDARRAHPGVEIDADGVESIRLHGLAAGLRSVLENALANAVRHGPATRVEVAAHAVGETVTLTVDDNGAGVPAPDRDRVFERFQRAGTTAPGSGLGLALIAQQARLHGGTAALTDSPLGGARLTLTLALNRP